MIHESWYAIKQRHYLKSLHKSYSYIDQYLATNNYYLKIHLTSFSL